MKKPVLILILLALIGLGAYGYFADPFGGPSKPAANAAPGKVLSGAMPASSVQAEASFPPAVRLQAPDLSTISGGPMLSFNFDDGILSTYQLAIPILDAAGFRSTQYIITGAFAKKGYVNQAQVLDMYAQGHEIGAHTRTHPYLSQISIASATDEIAGSKQDLIAMGITPATFAYPYGDESAAVEDIVKKAGFAGARITQPEYDDHSTDPFLLKRQRVQADTSFEEVKKAIDTAITEKKWIILVMHGIGDGGAEDITPQMFQEIVDYVKEKNIPVVTTAEGLQLISKIK